LIKLINYKAKVTVKYRWKPGVIREYKMTDLYIDEKWLEEFVISTTKELVGIRTVNYRPEDFPDK
jgi:hypothetical protein